MTEYIDNADVVDQRVGMTYEEIAKELGTTVRDVKRIEKAALKKLARPTEQNKAFRKMLQG